MAALIPQQSAGRPARRGALLCHWGPVGRRALLSSGRPWLAASSVSHLAVRTAAAGSQGAKPRPPRAWDARRLRVARAEGGGSFRQGYGGRPGGFYPEGKTVPRHDPVGTAEAAEARGLSDGLSRSAL